MNFQEKLYNTYVYFVLITIGRYYTTVPSNKLAKQIFGEIPDLDEIARNKGKHTKNNNKKRVITRRWMWVNNYEQMNKQIYK